MAESNESSCKENPAGTSCPMTNCRPSVSLTPTVVSTSETVWTGAIALGKNLSCVCFARARGDFVGVWRWGNRSSTQSPSTTTSAALVTQHGCVSPTLGCLSSVLTSGQANYPKVEDLRHTSSLHGASLSWDPCTRRCRLAARSFS